MSRSFRQRALFAIATLIAAPLTAQIVTTDPANHAISPGMLTLPLHIGGRVQATPLPPPMPKGATAYRHDWPGIYFEGAFVGDRVMLKFDDAGNEYRLLIDDKLPIPFFRPGKVEVTIDGLGAKPHHVRLEKVSESFLGRGAFDGFYIPSNERPLSVKPRRRQIEFIGPSGMTGFGARSAKTECTFEELTRTTDTQRAGPALVAKHYDADYQINANSGHGLIRNVHEIRKEPGLIALYPYSFLDRTAPYSDPNWQPQIIEISALADYTGEPEPGEKWTTLEQLFDDWTRSYQAFILDLHRRSPRAAFLLDWADDSDFSGTGPEVDLFRKKFAAARQAIIAMGQRNGIRSIQFVTIGALRPKLKLTGCDHHPSLKDHRVLAGWLESVIDAHPGIWDGK